MSHYQNLTLTELKANPDLTGYFNIDLENNHIFHGKLVNGKKNGIGSTYKVLDTTFWVNNQSIDDIPLPNEVTVNQQLKSCELVKFSFKTNSIHFHFSYYIPFISHDAFNDVIQKVLKQTDLSPTNITVQVNQTVCDLDKSMVDKIFDINNIVTYISNLDSDCSECLGFNRSWTCCGQFAPFLYIYYFLLHETDYDQLYANMYNQQNLSKPMQIYRIATVFYKMFTGYGSEWQKYDETRANLADIYNVNIQNVHDDTNYWLNVHPFQPVPLQFKLQNDVGYIFLLKSKNEIHHFGFLLKFQDSVIICDSWAHDSYKRFPVIRVMKYTEFTNSVIKINTLYNKLLGHKRGGTNGLTNTEHSGSNSEHSGSEHSGSEQSDSEQSSPDIHYSDDLLLYNFIMDSLFLVPYNFTDIKKGKQTFTNDLTYFCLVDSKVIDNALDILDTNNANPFDMYYNMGGKRKKQRSRQRSKKRKGTKKKLRARQPV